ncbi:SAM-dependent methyltransferase [Corynebacterium pseudotuberculosis P54B96]|nr:SAM-dependent methyltransferase [Corynebacterium pseudotuberculosis P54B96]
MTHGSAMCSATLEEYTTSKVSEAKGRAVPLARTAFAMVIPAADISPTSGSTLT